MTFSEISYTPGQSEFLTHLDEIGAVLETVILTPQETVSNVYEASRSAALTAMDILATRYEQQFQRTNPALNIQDYFNIKIFNDKELIGEPVDFNNFVGPGYDLVNKKQALYTYGDHNTRTSNVKDGFAYALINTPYGLRHSYARRPKHTSRSQHEGNLITELLKTYFELILSVSEVEDIEDFSIFSWSTDWSNYFDDGKEWWGTFCWTIYNPEANTITFIAASTTD